MSAGDWTVLCVGVLAGALVVATAVQLLAVRRTVRELRAAVEELRAESLATVTTLRRAVRETGAELERVDSVLAAADTVGQGAEAASRFAYAAFGSPVVKALAFGEGTRRAVRRLRGGSPRS